MELIDIETLQKPSFSWSCRIETHDRVGLRTAYWPSWRGSENIGTVCILQSRAECIENYYEVVRELLERGFAVLAFDWRGQGGSDKKLDNIRKGHIDDFIEYQYDLHAIRLKILPLTPQPHFCLAHGMGGTIALEAASRGMSPFCRQVLVSPMIELSSNVRPKLTNATSWVGNTLGYGEEFYTGDRNMFIYGTSMKDFQNNPFTSDEKRFSRYLEARKNFGNKAIGMPTISWMQAVQKQLSHFSQSDFKRKMTVPTVTVSGTADRICLSTATEKLLSSIKVVQTLTIRGARHDILNERDTYRKELWAVFDVFVPGETLTLTKVA